MLFVCHPKILHKHCLQFLLEVKMARREYVPYFLIGSSHETSSLNFISFMKCVWMYFRMFITTVCVLFLLKLRWPKNKSIYHQSRHWSSYSHLLVRQISVIPQIILKHFDSFISFHSFIVQSCVDNEPQSPPDLKKVNKRYHHHHHHHHHFFHHILYLNTIRFKAQHLWSRVRIITI